MVASPAGSRADLALYVTAAVFLAAAAAVAMIREIPADFAEFRAFKADYERHHFTFAPSNRRIGRYTLDLFCSWYPAVLEPVVSRAVIAMLDPSMVRAFGFTAPPACGPPGAPRR